MAYTVTITGNGSAGVASVTINGTTYANPATVSVEAGTLVECAVDARGITVNGVSVEIPYSFEVIADTTIALSQTSVFGYIDITFEESVDPMAPHDGHNTNIGQVARQIEGGTVLNGGVLREIESGMTLVGGVGREIAFAPKICTVTLEGSPSSSWCCIAIDGTKTTKTGIYEVEAGTVITCYARGYSGKGCKITLNGVTVKSGSTTQISYDYTVTTDVVIECGHGSSIVSYTNITEQ